MLVRLLESSGGGPGWLEVRGAGGRGCGLGRAEIDGPGACAGLACELRRHVNRRPGHIAIPVLTFVNVRLSDVTQSR